MSHQSLRSPEASRERAGRRREERGAGFRKGGGGGCVLPGDRQRKKRFPSQQDERMENVVCSELVID